MMREMVLSCLSGTCDGIAHGDFAPEMMSSTKLSTVSAHRGSNGKGVRENDGCKEEMGSAQWGLNVSTAS